MRRMKSSVSSRRRGVRSRRGMMQRVREKVEVWIELDVQASIT
jgi:hypothetical protein